MKITKRNYKDVLKIAEVGAAFPCTFFVYHSKEDIEKEVGRKLSTYTKEKTRENSWIEVLS